MLVAASGGGEGRSDLPAASAVPVELAPPAGTVAYSLVDVVDRVHARDGDPRRGDRFSSRRGVARNVEPGQRRRRLPTRLVAAAAGARRQPGRDRGNART